VFSFVACVCLASLGMFGSLLATERTFRANLINLTPSLKDWYGSAKVKKVQADGGEVISWRHILRFPLSTWIIYGICVFFYIGVLTFYTVARYLFSSFFKRNKVKKNSA